MYFSDQLLIKLYQNFKDKVFNPYQGEINMKVKAKKLSDTINHLSKKCYLKKTKRQKYYVFTSKGVSKVKELLKEDNKKQKQKWDGKWRVVIFDVPEKRKDFRNHIRRILYNLNFIRLQRSVWITPYDILDDLEDLLPSVKKGDWIRILIVEKISNEEQLKREFALAV